MKTPFLVAVVINFGLVALAMAANVHYVFSPAGNYPGAAETFPLAANLKQIVGYYASATSGGAYI